MAAISPARTKYRKSMKGSRAGNAKRGNTLAFGEFGLQSLTRGPMTGQRSCSRHHLPALKAEGEIVDSDFPAQARFQKAGRGPHGARQRPG